MDFKPRQLDAGNLMIMANLSTMVIKQLERDVALSAERTDNEAGVSNMNKEFLRTMDLMDKYVVGCLLPAPPGYLPACDPCLPLYVRLSFPVVCSVRPLFQCLLIPLLQVCAVR